MLECDVQIKRIHEYKRQYLNMLSVLWRYKQLKKMSPEERASSVPRVVVVGGKAASAYDMAKRIIRLVTAISEKVTSLEPSLHESLLPLSILYHIICLRCWVACGVVD